MMPFIVAFSCLKMKLFLTVKIDFYYNSIHINIGLVLITDNDERYADYQLLVENLGRAKPDVLVMDYQYVLERKNFVSNLRRFLHVFVA